MRPSTGPPATRCGWGRAAAKTARRASRPQEETMAARAPDEGGLERPAPTVVVATMRRRHLRGVLQIEQQVYPRPWTFGLFLSELGQRSTRIYLVARVGHRVVGYLGMLRSLEDGHITTIAVDPAWQ